jgi:Flp pilus assembly pilin Flp
VRLLSNLRKDERGATIVEFAFVLGPLLLLLLGGFELAYESYLRSALQGALTDAARRASVQDPVFSQAGATIEEKVEASILDIASAIAPDAQVEVTQQSYFDFSVVGHPEQLMSDENGNGQYDASDGDCFEDANSNGTFDTDRGAAGGGTSDDVVFYRAEVTAPRLLPVETFTPFAGNFTITLETAIRNQPYGNRATPPVVCGD